MSANKVQDGTPKFDKPSLCESCQFALIIRGESESQLRIACGFNNMGPVKFKVTACTGYNQRTATPLHEMNRMAWHLCVDKKTREMGFISPNERRKQGAGFSVHDLSDIDLDRLTE